ncbi:hypothetical protein K5D48_12575 [Pseudomonas cichorii]|nr:hypothetical protein [Pseudomonas cichorii]
MKIKALRCIIYLTVILCTACVKTAQIPVADLNLLSFGPAPKYPYTVTFTSSVDLQHVFNDYENSNQLNPSFICSLDPGAKLTVDTPINIGATGRVEAKSSTRPNHIFTSELIFRFNNPDGTQRDLNVFEAFKPLLEAKESIPCRVFITAYGYKAYYTNILFIPSTLILEQINK